MASLLRSSRLAFVIGVLAVLLLAVIGGRSSGSAIAEDLAARTAPVLAEADPSGQVRAEFRSPNGLPSRHPVLVGGENLNEAVRDRVAKAVAGVPGVGGIRWSDGDALVESQAQAVRPLHCEEDVAALLRARTIRFEESSSRMDAASRQLIDEVATALRPCLGSIIAITGHTDNSGPEPGNLELSRERAAVVRAALIERGIPADGLRARGVGSRDPVEGLAPGDTANRRIDFAVIATEPISPTPVDTPGPR